MQARLFIKLCASLLAVLTSICLGIVLPRGLGIEQYGQYAFLLASFVMLMDVFVTHTAVAYIYLLSQGSIPNKLINTVYCGFVLLSVLLISVITELSLQIGSVREFVWGNISDQRWVYWAMLISIATVTIKVISDFADATQQTLKVEPGRIFNNLVLLSAIGYLAMSTNQWQLDDFYLISVLALSPFFLIALSRLTFPVALTGVKTQALGSAFSEMYQYSRPLLALAVVAALGNYVGRFSVQSQYSVEEFAYFAFAMAIVSIPVSVISPIMTIFIAEIARQFENNEREKIVQQFLTASQRIGSVMLAFAIFVFCHADALILALVGEAYLPSAHVVRILLVFCVFNAISLLNGNLFFSTGRVDQYSRISLIVLGISLATFAASFFVFSMDAALFAGLTTLSLVVRTSILNYLNARFLNFSFLKFWGRLLIIGSVIALPIVVSAQLFGTSLTSVVTSAAGLLLLNLLFRDFVGLADVLGLLKNRPGTT